MAKKIFPRSPSWNQSIPSRDKHQTFPITFQIRGSLHASSVQFSVRTSKLQLRFVFRIPHGITGRWAEIGLYKETIGIEIGGCRGRQTRRGWLACKLSRALGRFERVLYDAILPDLQFAPIFRPQIYRIRLCPRWNESRLYSDSVDTRSFATC